MEVITQRLFDYVCRKPRRIYKLLKARSLETRPKYDNWLYFSILEITGRYNLIEKQNHLQ